MKISETKLKGLLLIEVDRFEDDRGYFMEAWQRERYHHVGIREEFVQDNLSCSTHGVLRGLHYQHPHGQGKLVYVVHGEVYDVVVDIRRASPTFGRYEGFYLSADNRQQLYIPEGFAHGFCVTSSHALFAYKCTNYYNIKSDKGIQWDDSSIGINWPIAEPILSEKDKALPSLVDIKEADLFRI